MTDASKAVGVARAALLIRGVDHEAAIIAIDEALLSWAFVAGALRQAKDVLRQTSPSIETIHAAVVRLDRLSQPKGA